MATLRWLRVPGDNVFALGVVAFVVFVFGAGRTGSAARTVPNVPPSSRHASTPAE